MKDFPKLVSDRLILDQIKPSDIPEIVSYAGNIKIIENTRTMPHPYFEEDAIAWMNTANEGFKAKNNYMFAIRFTDSQAFMGGIGLTLDVANNRAELGYWLAEKFWNKGFTTEAVHTILKFGFEHLKLNKVVAVYLTSNEASGKVMIKNGMVKEGIFKEHDAKRGNRVENNTYASLIQYRMLKSEYEALKKQPIVKINLLPILENENVLLTPLTLENYENLIPVASQEKLVQYSPSVIHSPDSLRHYVTIALEQREREMSIPFIIFDKVQQGYAGSTRYMNIQWKNKVLEIGSTWIGREFQGSGLNFQMKHLMINHAFDIMGFEKIEFRIDERNMRSRKAVEKLGGVFEGTLRRDVYLLDRFKRNTCCYGILKEEWKEQQTNLS